MHKGLAPYRVAAGHHGDGHSEWFAPSALPSALQLLRQMPGDDPAGGARPSAPLRPLLIDQPEIVWVEVDQSPQDVWYGVEDLWLRLAAELPVRAEADGLLWRVVVQGFRHARDGRMQELRSRALDSGVFTWRLNGQRGAFVKLIAYEGDDLVFTVAEHMPASHRAHRQWTPAKLIAWGERIGAATGGVVRWQMEHRPHPEQGYRSCLGLMRLARQYGDERLEAACARAQSIRAPNYRSVKSILECGLDRQDAALLGAAAPSMPSHDKVRGPGYYGHH